MDHALRNDNAPQRVIGVLLGVRSDDGSEVEIRSTYAVPHVETSDEVNIDVDYLASMYNLHRRAYPRDSIVGWYSTSLELNNLSGLIHDLFSSNLDGLVSQPPIHLTVPTYDTITSSSNNNTKKSKQMEDDDEKEKNKQYPKDIVVNTYVSSLVGLNYEKSKGSLFFVPIPNEIRFSEIERSGLDSIAKARDIPSRTFGLINDIQTIETTLTRILEMLDRVSSYVNNVIESGKENNSSLSPGSTAIGKFLYKNLSLVPSISKENLEKLFNSHLQDVLMVVYLANTVKTQLQLSSRLTPIV